MELVVFDTNIFVGNKHPKSAYWQKFREHRSKVRCEVALPAVVFLELPRKLVSAARARAEKLEERAKDLAALIVEVNADGWNVRLNRPDGLTLDATISALQQLRAENAKTDEQLVTELLERMLGGPFRVLPFPTISHEALVRRCCIEERKPFPSKSQTANQGKKQKGEGPSSSEQPKDTDRSYRDTLTWFSLLEEVARLDKKTDRIVFVTKDAGEFADKGEDSRFHADLRADMQALNIKEDRLLLWTSLESFLQPAPQTAKTIDEEKLLRASLMRDSNFCGQLQWKAVELAAPLSQRMLTIAAKVPHGLADLSLGVVSLLSVSSAQKLESGEEFALRIEVSVRGTIEFENTVSSTTAFPMAETITAGAIYDAGSKRIVAVTVESSEPDTLFQATRRVTTQPTDDGTLTWIVALEDINQTGARVVTYPKLFSKYEDLVRCLQDLGAPTEGSYDQPGTRKFGGEEIPLKVATRWGLLRMFVYWKSPDAPIYFDAPGYYIDFPPPNT